MPNDTFRVNAKSIFLTYPQCGDLSKQRVLEFLRDDEGATWYSVGLEQHEDGGNHIHAIAEFPTRRNIRDCRHFDVDGCHANIQSARNKSSVLRYVQKGGDFIGNMHATSGGVGYGEIIANSTGTEDFLARVIREDPRRAVYGLQHLQYFAEHQFGRESDDYVPNFEFKEDQLTEEMKTWLTEEFPKVCKWSRGAPVPSLPWQLLYPLMPILARTG